MQIKLQNSQTNLDKAYDHFNCKAVIIRANNLNERKKKENKIRKRK
jgi:hypothetical protein